MAKKEKQTNEVENSFEGCYGEIVKHDDLSNFLDFNFAANLDAEKQNRPRFAQCIWGSPGIGKTAKCKQYRDLSTNWNGKDTKWVVHDVPLAQFEEMGDFHGLPTKCVFMKGPEGERWVPEEHITDYRSAGWQMDLSYTPRTQMAPPDWVPSSPGPSILLMDDWNRASVRIVKGIMQLLQNYGMVSWKLPAGCNIVLTGNPDLQDFLVTSLDSAILTRIKHITLQADVKQWAQWAYENDLDPRGVQWILTEPDYLKASGAAKMTNPRTLAEFFNVSKKFKSFEQNSKELAIHGKSLLDPETVTAFSVFLSRDYEFSIEPETILNESSTAINRIKDLMGRAEPRVDVVSVTCERLLAHMGKKTCEYNEIKRKHFQDFILADCFPEDLRHSLCSRLAKKRESNGQRWVMGNKVLAKCILETVH